jgi:hypothetical protein
VREIRTVPYVPLSHPFVERLIGTVRREYLDRDLFWTTADLEMKLLDFQHYLMLIARMLGWRDDCQNRVFADLHHLKTSVPTGGKGTAEGCTRLPSPA